MVLCHAPRGPGQSRTGHDTCICTLQVRVDAKQLAREAQFSEGAVRRIEGKLRQLLVDAAAPLPWSPSITAANVGQHLRLIMKLELASNME